MDTDGDKIADEARATLLRGCGLWIDQWDWTAGSVITGWLTVIESVRPDGTVDLTWASGNGDDTEDDSGGLPPHRVDGMARHVSRDIEAMRIEAYVRRQDDE
jgi:hypothetical protein